MDNIDRKILLQLQRDARISNLELAEKVGLSPTPCARRVKRLEDEGYITAYRAELSREKLGLNLSALISISMDRHTPDRFENFEREVSAMPEIVACNLVTGQSADYLLTALVADMTHYEKFLLGKLTKIDGVTGVHSSFVLREVPVAGSVLL